MRKIFSVVLVFTVCSFGWAEEYNAGDSLTITANDVSFQMQYVPSGGPFVQGEHVLDTTKTIDLKKSFWIGQAEVTQGLWVDVLGEYWPFCAPAEFKIDFGSGDNYPVYFISWYDAVLFCNELTIAESTMNHEDLVYFSDQELSIPYESGEEVYADLTRHGYRLPTEAEWEYAARYIDGKSWNHGNHVSGQLDKKCRKSSHYQNCEHDTASVDEISKYAWWEETVIGEEGDAGYGSAEVALRGKIPNALGIYDMSGNVGEWCWVQIEGETQGAHVAKGGWWGSDAENLATANRYDIFAASSRIQIYGFRIARNAN